MENLFALSGKTALVTGGAQGLGRMIAEGLVRSGARVFITSRKPETCQSAAAEMSTYGQCTGIPADLGSPTGASELATELRQHTDRLDILVNNAGKTWGAPLESFPDAAWGGVMAVNVQAPFTLVRELLALLRNAGSNEDPARVINVGSLAGLVVERLDAYSYGASKAAIHHLSRMMAVELAESHITVNAVVPGYFPTKMTAHIRDQEDAIRELQDRIPLRRLGSPEDIAGLCIFLSSRAGAYITGSVIAVDGGLSGCR